MESRASSYSTKALPNTTYFSVLHLADLWRCDEVPALPNFVLLSHVVPMLRVLQRVDHVLGDRDGPVQHDHLFQLFRQPLERRPLILSVVHSSR